MNDITKLLKAWKSGDNEALDKLMTLIVPELKRIAHKYMSAERPGNILQTTALVNEAVIKLISEKISFEDRKQFYRVVGKRMRQVLMDEARKRLRVKRGKGAFEQLDDRTVDKRSSERSRVLQKLDAVLEGLKNEDKQKAAIVEYHFFIGLSFAEVAELLGLSKTRVERDWNSIRLQLKREMTGE